MDERSFLWWIVIGLVAGVVAKLAVPGRDPGGIVVTILIGIAGALLAGFVGQALGHAPGRGWIGWVSAIAGSIVLLLLYRVLMRTHHRR